MNYDHLFRNLAKTLTPGFDPEAVGQAPASQPREVAIPSDSIVDGFSVGSIAGQSSQKLLDKRDHFPVFTETQAHSSMSRAMQLTDVPVWYNGSLDGLRKDVYEGIAKAHPTLVGSLNVNVPASRIIALSDGGTPAQTSQKSIKDPADVVKTQAPGTKRPTLTSAELVKACEDENVRIALAGKLLECIEQQEADLSAAKKLATTLVKKGMTSEQFDGLSTWLQGSILSELTYNQSNATNASADERRRELLARMQDKKGA